MPKILNRLSVVLGSAVVSHFAYITNVFCLDNETDVLDQYTRAVQGATLAEGHFLVANFSARQ